MDDLTIRPARAEDFDAVWPILRRVFRAGDTYAVDPGIGPEAARALWFEAPRATWLAEAGGAVLGSYYLKTNQAGGGAHVCNAGYIVAEAARGRGVARAMCAHSQAEARAMGYLAMQFNFVVSTNTGAIALWQALGFDTVGRLPRAFRHPAAGLVDALVMFKWLGPPPG
ncbi:MAG: GNAT family N-acetyltransferase [Roseovarius sp.]|nr:GNAT family N-acetyltransferase [Roseovarius sp.]